MSVAFKDKALRDAALAWKDSPYEASGLSGAPEPIRIFARIGLLLLIACGFALAAQWFVGAPLGAG